jgi:hypothetical protein
MPSYRPIFYMPVVAPPAVDSSPAATEEVIPPYTDPSTNYAALTGTNAVVAVAAANQGLRISLSGAAKNVILSMAGGSVSYVPKGNGFALSNGTEVKINPHAVPTGDGSVVVEVWAQDYWRLLRDLPADIQAISCVLYHNVKNATVRTALEPHVKEMAARQLEVGTGCDLVIDGLPTLTTKFLDNVMAGVNSVFVAGGTVLGEAEAPASGSGAGAETTLQFLDGNGCEFSPIRHIRAMPNLGGSHWTDHPLIAAVANLAVGDPATVSSPSPVGYKDYDGGTTLVNGRTYKVNGTVYYPATSEGKEAPFKTPSGPVPIVFIAHGNHGTYYEISDRTKEHQPAPIGGYPPQPQTPSFPDLWDAVPGGWVQKGSVKTPGSGWVQPGWTYVHPLGWIDPDWAEIPNHKGYVYFQERLAAMGIIAVSVNLNQTSMQSYTASNIMTRAELILKSIAYFETLNMSDAIFGSHIDFANVGLMGHSRGGEAVIVVREKMPSTVTIKAVIAVAPTDARAIANVPAGYGLMIILPAGDGDVINNDGAKFYDRAIPDPFACQLYVFKTNHNYFNREWLTNDGHGPGMMFREDHERILSAYGSAFFRRLLLGHPMVGYFNGDLIPETLPHCQVHISFKLSKTNPAPPVPAAPQTVDDHEDKNGIGMNSLGLPTAASGVTVYECIFIKDANDVKFQAGSTFYGDTVGMIMEWTTPGGTFCSQLAGPTDVSGREVWVRVAELYNGTSVPAGATGFELGLETADVTAWVDSDRAGGIPRPFDRRADDIKRLQYDRTKTMLKTLRFKATYFTEAVPNLDLTKVTAIFIRCNRSDPRALAFDDLQIVSI